MKIFGPIAWPYQSIIFPQSSRSLHTLTHKHTSYGCVRVLTHAAGGVKSALLLYLGRITRVTGSKTFPTSSGKKKLLSFHFGSLDNFLFVCLLVDLAYITCLCTCVWIVWKRTCTCSLQEKCISSTCSPAIKSKKKKKELVRFNKVKLLLQTKHGHINLKQFYNLQYI